MIPRNLIGLPLLALTVLLTASSAVELVGASDFITGVLRGVLRPIRSVCEATVAVFEGQTHYSHVVLALVALSVVLVAAPGIASALVQILKSRRLAKVLAHNELQQLPEHVMPLVERSGLAGRVKVFRSDGFYAFCLGFLRPRVWLASSVIEALPPAELEAVLRHESCHVRRRDPLRVLVASAARASFFFVPVLREINRVFLVNKELIADAATVREMDDKYPLASALQIALSRKPGDASERQLVGAFSAIDARIDQLVNGPADQPLLLRTPALSFLTSAPVASIALLGMCLVLTGAEIGATAGPVCSVC